MIDDKPFRKLTRFESDQMYLTEILIHGEYYNLTNISEWDYKPIEDSFAGATVEVKNNVLYIITERQNSTITLDETGKPVSLGDYTVSNIIYEDRPTKDIPSAHIHLGTGRRLYDSTSFPEYIGKANPQEPALYECFKKLTAFSGEVTRVGSSGGDGISSNTAYIFNNMEDSPELSSELSKRGIYRTLSSIPECSVLNSNIKVASFQGTYPPTLTDLYYDILSIADNFRTGYCGLYNWYDPCSYDSLNKSPAKQFDFCVGHSLGSARAVNAASNGYCKNVVTFAPPLAKLTNSVPITQYINLQKADFCCDWNWSWTKGVYCANKNTWYSDIIPQVGYLGGDNYNPHFITIENGVRKYINIDTNCIAGPVRTLWDLGASASVKLHFLHNY